MQHHLQVAVWAVLGEIDVHISQQRAQAELGVTSAGVVLKLRLNGVVGGYRDDHRQIADAMLLREGMAGAQDGLGGAAVLGAEVDQADAGLGGLPVDLTSVVRIGYQWHGMGV